MVGLLGMKMKRSELDWVEVLWRNDGMDGGGIEGKGIDRKWYHSDGGTPQLYKFQLATLLQLYPFLSGLWQRVGGVSDIGELCVQQHPDTNPKTGQLLETG